MAAALSAPTLAGAHVGALVIDAATGATVFSRDAESSFQPASTLKLVVGTAAITLLGSDYALVTDVLTDANVSAGSLRGSLYLRGGGDPTLDAAALNEAAQTLRQESIAQIDGGIVADASHFDASMYPPGWVIDDLAQDYAAPVSALSYNDGVVALALAPGVSPGTPVSFTMTPQTPDVIVINNATTGDGRSPDTTSLERSLDDPRQIVLSGSLPAGTRGAELDAAAATPPLFAADAMRASLNSAGIRTKESREGITPQTARLVWHHRSEPMRTLLARMWLPSDNLLAESLLEELGTRSITGTDTRARGIARESQWLHSIGVDMDQVEIADGSGLSQYDRLSPEALVRVLRAGWTGPDRDAIVAALPAAGERGTLAHAFMGSFLRGAVIAKTGSMSHVRTLAGFVVRPGRSLIFALMVNDWMDRSPNAGAALRLVEQRFLEAAATHP